MHYEELIKDHAPNWPYTVDYQKEHEVSSDVLVLGGGIAGCWAAISAARKGAKVVLVDKGATKTSGAGGSGVDHWHAAVTNPGCTIDPLEFSKVTIENYGGWRCGISQHITSMESYDCLLELESMGMKIRDSEDEFKGADFRDEDTKLLFAYDYTAKYCVRVWGAHVKQFLYDECLRLGVKIFDRVMVTSLLNKGGKIGAQVVGATGISVRTGEFYIFKARASILSMFLPQRQFIFSTELKGLASTHRPSTASGDGHAMAWRAGAEFAQVEHSGRGGGLPYGYPQYGVGNAHNTWFACTMVDANGKEIPWVDRNGRELTSVAQRYRPAPGQKYFLDMGWQYEYRSPMLAPDWRERVKKGEFTLPIYADLASMPEHERRIIWGMMIAQEGRTLIPIYHTYSQAGFDPDKDLLQSYDGGWGGLGPPQWRTYSSGTSSGGGPIVNWNLKTTLDGLYAAGGQIFASGDHAYAAATGRYAGRKAAEFARSTDEMGADRRQIDAEKLRVYAPAYRNTGMDWKELNAGICKILQDYCGELKNEELLTIGLKWLDELESGEAATARARNPHELYRVLEVYNIITVGRMMLESSRARKASSSHLDFTRTDYPEVDPPEWNRWVTIKLDGGDVKVGELALDYYGDMEKNYQDHCGL
ncbi:MAG: FAD-dependent oxidoreductase [Dehalococcoidales bacterium]|nr:FAD-dependent oxidoreductase [Dehalococcoidales bacterium]